MEDGKEIPMSAEGAEPAILNSPKGIPLNEGKAKRAKDLSYDANAIRVLSKKRILARIMKDHVGEYSHCDIEEIIACIEGEPELRADISKMEEFGDSFSEEDNMEEDNVENDDALIPHADYEKEIDAFIHEDVDREVFEHRASPAPIFIHENDAREGDVPLIAEEENRLCSLDSFGVKFDSNHEADDLKGSDAFLYMESKRERINTPTYEEDGKKERIDTPTYEDDLEKNAAVYEDDDLDENDASIHGDGNSDKSIQEGDVYFDILFHARLPKSDEEVGLIVNLEVQNEDRRDRPITKRAIYYVSRLLSSEKGKYFFHSDYAKLKKVYSIWVCPFPQKSKRMTAFRIHLKGEAVIGRVEEKIQDYDLLEIVILRIGDPNRRTVQDALQMLSILFSREIQNIEKSRRLKSEFGIQLKGREIRRMTMAEGYFNQGLERGLERGLARGREEGMARGLERGLERGLARGREEGMEIGRFQNLIDIIKNIMKKFNYTLEQSMDFLDVKKEERPAIAAMF